ncbi:MAG: response regulator transcription factor [Acidimicrobiia bacterium]|jgi:DNA-binding response OmpR family regulator|nr:response regulator transcription factor [Acidimicrobiia bacterium]
MARSQRVLVVDDEPRVREVVVAYLERDGFRVTDVASVEAARAHLDGLEPDLVILDVMLPAESGLDLLADLRRGGDTPVILLTSRSEETDKILGLELGADDYVTKPFSPRELVARVRSVLRRSGGAQTPESTSLEYDRITLDHATREVTVDGDSVDLTAKEFDLLFYLASHPRQVFSRNQLLEQVWDSSSEWQDPATVTVHIRRIRTKIEADPKEPKWLTTVWGVGYRFEP